VSQANQRLVTSRGCEMELHYQLYTTINH